MLNLHYWPEYLAILLIVIGFIVIARSGDPKQDQFPDGCLGMIFVILGLGVFMIEFVIWLVRRWFS